MNGGDIMHGHADMPELRGQIFHIETPTHGRVRYDAGAGPSAGLVVVLHGYGQSADDVMASVQQLPGIERWRIAAPQALHRFYTRDQQKVVASWMTREDRDLAIADNVAYVGRVIDRVGTGPGPLVFAGFSQGASMAYRAAVLGRHAAAGVIALGGDIPPEVRAHADAGEPVRPWPAVLIGAGVRDDWYTERLDGDLAFLTAHAIAHEVVRFDGGHEWTTEFGEAAGRWLTGIL